jgi:hypothetical protein
MPRTALHQVASPEPSFDSDSGKVADVKAPFVNYRSVQGMLQDSHSHRHNHTATATSIAITACTTTGTVTVTVPFSANV